MNKLKLLVVVSGWYWNLVAGTTLNQRLKEQEMPAQYKSKWKLIFSVTFDLVY